MGTIEELYKYYETLTDAKEKAGEVRSIFKPCVISGNRGL